jgi:DNA-binding NarL/FixJ family response regulator
MQIRVLIIDDDATWRFLYHKQLSQNPVLLLIGEFENAIDALAQIPHLKPDLIIVDYALPGMTGLEFSKKLKEYPNIKILLATGHEREHFKSQIECSHNFDIINKTLTDESIRDIIAFARGNRPFFLKEPFAHSS